MKNKSKTETQKYANRQKVQEMEKYFRKQKAQEAGITLIALVVTIIVLLILAGVSISTIAGQNGLMGRASNAVDTNKKASVIDSAKQDILDRQLEKASTTGDLDITESDLETILNKYFDGVADADITNPDTELTANKNNGGEKVKVKISEIYDGTINSVDNSTLVAMYNQAIADNCTNQDGSCTNENHLHIGDYVQYTNPTSGSYTVTSGTLGVDYAQTYNVALNQLNWRVMGMDSTTGGIKIMASQPMKKSTSSDSDAVDESDPYLHMYGAKSYTNSLTELKNICELYTTEYGTARSITQDDVDELTGVTTTALKQQYNLDPYYGGKNIGETYSFTDQYTPESYLNNKTKTTVSGTVTGYYYSVNGEYKSGAPYVTMSNTRAYNMLFNNTEAGTGRHYWLASLAVNAYSSYASFGPCMAGSVSGVAMPGHDGLFRSDGGKGGDWAGVCPVVSLKSNITKTQVPKISDVTETEWKYGGSSGDEK